jgi:hypothetical protein
MSILPKERNAEFGVFGGCLNNKFGDLFMRELTFEEMDAVAGGLILLPRHLILQLVDYLVDNSDNYINYLVQCWETYGAGAYDYSALYRAQSN